ncbi:MULTISPECIES: thermonuclease family protein [unclassified Sphingopyxis]|uniref:thermonuclease family protein n=1 Tax=unclassified Sphingopyxis TaxID=2614943 RepID=UPI000AD7D33A|nr:MULTISPECIES: thermonuclease family protein [unclassified Sphingopyxis]
MNALMFGHAGAMLLILAGGELLTSPAAAPAQSLAAGACRAIDGDTLRCGEERVRLLGIDAAEKKGHCRQGRVCAPGNPEAHRAALQRLVSARITIMPVKRDRYGRMVAIVQSAGGINLSCAMLAEGASYVARWDDRKMIWRSCASTVRRANHL